jgi:hypothetical protein
VQFTNQPQPKTGYAELVEALLFFLRRCTSAPRKLRSFDKLRISG